MAPTPKGKHPNERRASWRETEVNGSTVIFITVKEAATYAPFKELKKAASMALIALQTIQGFKVNKEAYERLGDDAGGLIAAIWRSYKKAEAPNEWLSAGMREILEDLTHTLDNICSFVQEQLTRSKAIRVLFSRADAGKINEYREHLNYAMQKFELQSHMNINDVLIQLMRKNDQLSEQILHLNEEEDVKRLLEISAREASDREEAERIQEEEELKAVKEISSLESLKQLEIDSQASNERLHPDNLKQKETKDRQSELTRLRAVASTVEEANRLKKEEEEEIAELRRIIAAQEESLRDTMIKAKTSNQKLGESHAMIEEVDSEGEEICQSPEESDDESISNEEEKRSPPPSRHSPKPKSNRKPQGSSRSSSPDVNNLLVQLRHLTPVGGSGYNSPSSASMYFPNYSPPSPPSMGPPYGYGYGPGTIVNSGVGNITNSSISNIGNNNSVKKVYHTGRQRRARAQLCN